MFKHSEETERLLIPTAIFLIDISDFVLFIVTAINGYLNQPLEIEQCRYRLLIKLYNHAYKKYLFMILIHSIDHLIFILQIMNANMKYSSLAFIIQLITLLYNK